MEEKQINDDEIEQNKEKGKKKKSEKKEKESNNLDKIEKQLKSKH